jgi:CheY-like chemotaxis protein
MAREGGPDLPTEVNDHVFRLNRSVTRLRAHLEAMEGALPDDPDSRSVMIRRMTGMGLEIDAIYRTMVRVRWAALGVPPGPESPYTSGKDPSGGPQPASRGQETTIYVVDDDPSVGKALSRLFRSVDYRVETFPSALKFLGAKRGPGPACLVLDYRMPRMGGLDLHRHLTASWAGIPIIFITGHGDMDLAVQAVKGGAVDFLPKPFDDQDLLDAVRRALEPSPAWDQSPIPEPPPDP